MRGRNSKTSGRETDASHHPRVRPALWLQTLPAVPASAVVAAIAGAWVLYHYPPTTTWFYPHCVFHEVTGLDCPGCGTTRALYQLVHGNIGAAFRLNAMLFPLMIFGGFATPSLLRGRTPAFVMKPWFGWGSFVVIVGWWIGRNVVQFG